MNAGAGGVVDGDSAGAGRGVRAIAGPYQTRMLRFKSAGPKQRYIGDRDGEVPDCRFVHGLLHEVCHGFFLLHNPRGCACCLHFPGNMTDDHTVGVGGYQPDFIGKRRNESHEKNFAYRCEPGGSFQMRSRLRRF